MRNREVSTYPIEYLFLGSDQVNSTSEVSLQDKLEQVNDGDNLRLFFWKLHNTVSASIAEVRIVITRIPGLITPRVTAPAWIWSWNGPITLAWIESSAIGCSASMGL